MTDEKPRAIYVDALPSTSEGQKALLELLSAGHLELKVRPQRSGPVERTPEEIVEHQVERVADHLAQLGARYEPTTGMFLWDKDYYAPEEMAQTIYGSMATKKGWTKDAVISALRTHINRTRRVLIENVRARILVYDSQIGNEELAKFVGLMTDCDPERANPLHILAIRSLIWQVKRKFAGHTKVEHPLCVVFVGGQGFGKSWHLDRLFAPVVEWKAPGQRLSVLNNQFNMNVFSNYFVIPFEEMSSAKSVDVEMLKSVLTEDYIAYRPPHERQTLKLPNNSTCYGTSNRSIRELIEDDTGARRWWEIEVPSRPFGPTDAARVATIDFARLWRSVDGSTEASPRRDFLDEFLTVQTHTVKYRSSIEDFFTETLLFDGASEDLPETLIYEAARSWFRDQDLRLPSRAALRRAAENARIKIRKSNGYFYYCECRFMHSASGFRPSSQG